MIRLDLILIGALAALLPGADVSAQESPSSPSIQPLPNLEMLLQLSGESGAHYRIETSASLPAWDALVTLKSTGLDEHTDSAAPYHAARFYRAASLTGSNILTGDHLPTPQGDVLIHPLFHASVVLGWEGRTIYIDPDDDAAYAATYLGLPKADLLLVSHSHGDHFSASRIQTVRATNAVIIAPQDVYDSLSAALRSLTIVLTNGATAEVTGLTIEAVPAYNDNHPRGRGNGYVLTIGGRRMYFSGDTGDIPEMRALPDIDVAFLCMNVPYTMTVDQAASAVRAFRPRVVYPYHYRNQGGGLSDLNRFKTLVAIDLGVEVRLRDWY